jgi:hypothetical protein
MDGGRLRSRGFCLIQNNFIFNIGFVQINVSEFSQSQSQSKIWLKASFKVIRPNHPHSPVPPLASSWLIHHVPVHNQRSTHSTPPLPHNRSRPPKRHIPPRDIDVTVLFLVMEKIRSAGRLAMSFRCDDATMRRCQSGADS